METTTQAMMIGLDGGPASVDEEAVTALLALTAKHEFGFLYHSTLLWEGVAQVWRGELDAGIERIQSILQYFADHEIYLLRPIYLAWLAHAQRQAGRDHQALDTVGEALALVAQRGERHYEAELRRLQGELLWAQGETIETVHKHFVAALDVARNQNARRLELRVLLSLYRLWDKAGNMEDAMATRKALQLLYDWFEDDSQRPTCKKPMQSYIRGAWLWREPYCFVREPFIALCERAVAKSKGASGATRTG